MASEIKLPELGENLTGGDVLDVKVSPGDTVSQGQTLLELEAEKSTVEVPAPVAGRVTQVLVKKGDSIQVGQTFCVIESGDGAKKEGPKTAPIREPAATQPPAPEPSQVARRRAEPSRPVERKREAAKAGTPAGPGEKAALAKPDGKRAEPAEAEPPPPPTRPEPAPAAPPVVPAGPATRRLARELGVDLGQVQSSAPGGRVTEEDVKAYVRSLASGAGMRGAAAPPLPDFERWGPVERQPLDAVRRKTAEQMSLAWSQIPHVTQHDLADITELESFRKQYEGRGPKLTVTAFALKAAAIALGQYPQFNASLDSAAGQLVIKRYYHVGVAVDTDRGLLVPVLRDVDKKSIHDLAGELAEIAERARQNKLSMDEMRGGTFTITNLGGIGGTGFSPIVNYPEVAILGMARARLQPVVREGQIIARLLLPLSLSYDHRVIDGANAARFTRRIAEMLENLVEMLVQA